MATRHNTTDPAPATRPPRRRPTNQPPHPNDTAMAPANPSPSTGHHLADTNPAQEGEPHPWGQPLPPGHPGYQPPPKLPIGAFARWLIYAVALALATAVTAMVVLAATEPADALEPATLEEVQVVLR